MPRFNLKYIILNYKYTFSRKHRALKIIALICPLCNKSFEKPQSYINKKKKEGFKKNYCSSKCSLKALHILQKAENKIKFNCKNCEKEILKTPSQIKKGSVFCSQSCSATFSNKHRKRKSKERHCKKCNKLYFYKPQENSRILCNTCYSSHKNSNHYKNLTIKKYLNLDPNKLPSYRYHRIRQFAKTWNSNRLQKCQYCGYDLHIEYCHIKHISEFSENTKLGIVNHSSNILILCPNHHWEFDNDYLKIGPEGLEPSTPCLRDRCSTS